jgi:hypothetical protein
MNDYQNNVKVVDGILLLKKVNSSTNPLITDNTPDDNEVIFYADENGVLKIKNQDGDNAVGSGGGISAEITTTETNTSVGVSADGSGNGAAFGYNSSAPIYGSALGQDSNGSDYGIAVGYNSNGSGSGAAVGYASNGFNSGAAVGDASNGFNSGAAFGYNSNGSNFGVAIGKNSIGDDYGVSIGVDCSTAGISNRIEIAPKDSFGYIRARASAQSTSTNWQFTAGQSDSGPTSASSEFGNADGTLPIGMWSAQIDAAGSNLVFYVNIGGTIKSGSVAISKWK